MKFLLTLAIAFSMQFDTMASDTAIVFRDISYSEVFETAKEENKAVLLYFHFDGCGACAGMEKNTFTDQKAANFFNKNFVCFEVNTRKEEGIETNKIYNVRLHPTFLILDDLGHVLNKIVGVYNPNEFVSKAKQALIPNKSYAHMNKRYKSGDRNPNFLLDYCYRLRDANEIDANYINEYLNTQRIDELNKAENIKFIYEFAILNGEACYSLESNAYKFMSENKDLFSAYFEMEQVDTRLMFTTLSGVFESIESGDSTKFWERIELLKVYDTGKEYNFQEMDGRITMWNSSKSLVLKSKLAYYQRTEDWVMYETTLEIYVNAMWNDSEALNNYAWRCYEVENDIVILEKAVECAIRSIELKSNYNNNDTYAALLYKLEDYDKALYQSQKAIEIAKKDKVSFSETADLVLKIKTKQKN